MIYNGNMIILRGLPGSGKTAFANYLVYFNNFVICTADDYFYDQQGNYNFDYSKISEAHKYSREKCEKALKEGRDVIVANTSVKEDEINEYIKLANQYNYRYFSLIVENRHGNENIHGVPDETIEKMKNKFSIKL